MLRSVLLGALFVVVLCRVFARGTSATPQYPTNSTLEDLLCNSSHSILPSVTTITLLPNANYTIHPGKACLVEDHPGPLTIHGTSEGNLALIYCIHDEANFGSRGFGFTGVNALTIENVQIENCGGLMSLPGPGNNNSHFAVILLNRSRAVQLRM